MDVWLLRHAEAEDRAASGKDEDRALTAAGLAEAAASARGIEAIAPEIRTVLTSPYRRARQTAEPAAAALKLPGVRATRALEPGSDPEEILGELAELADDAVLLVGHAPHLGRLLGRMVTGDPGADIPLSKAGAAWVSFEGLEAPGRLRAFLPVGILRKLL